MNGNERRVWIWLAIIVFVGLAARVGWAIHQNSISELPDQREYLELGKHLFESGLWMADPRFEQVVYAYRTPGYPFLIACCGADARVVRIVQCALDAGTIVAIFLLARRWLPAKGALLAAGIYALNPFAIFFCGLILSETLFTAMQCWGMTLLVISDGPWPPGNKLLGWLGGGALLALGILVRPGSLLLPVLLGVAGALVNRDVVAAYRQKWPLGVGATMLILCGLVLFPWAARNRWMVGAWVWTSTNDGITRYDGFNPDAAGASDQRFVQSMPWTKDMTELGRSRYFGGMADEWIAANPSLALQLAVVKMGRTWSPVPLSSEYGGRWMYWWAGLCYSAPLDLLVLVGLWKKNLAGRVKRFLVLPAVYFTIAAGLSVGSLRYRIPAEGPMAVIAASAACSFGRKRSLNNKSDAVN